MPSLDHSRQQQLEDAFLVFNQVSEQLTDSYQTLQDQVAHLNAELAAARSDRLRELAEKERLANRLSHLLEVMPAAVVVLDGAGHIQEFNPAAAKLFPSVTQGQLWVELYKALFAGECHGDELRLHDGTWVTLSECSLAPEPGRMLLLLDITKTRELQNWVNRQERLSTLGEMAAQLAHQIRTPLASALLDTAHFFREDLSQQRRHQFASRLRDRLRHMEYQIKDMLMFARGNQGAVAPIAISSLIKNLGQMLEPLLKSHHAHIDLIDHTGGQLLVNGNQDSLLGALANLVTNALDHGGAQVQLQVELALIPDAQLQIEVSDNGPGIPKDLLERIFDPFFTTSSGGTGLGLAVVQSVVMAHEGHITVQPSALGGACFQLRLPLYREPCLDEVTPVISNKSGVNEVCLRSLS